MQDNARRQVQQKGELLKMWEHYIEFIEADPQQEMEFVQQFYPMGTIPKYAMQAILPRLNHLGEQGWEVVQIQPVAVGKNGDILAGGAMSEKWTRTYMCVFKRQAGAS